MVCLFLGLATYVKRSFRFFERFFIPNAIIAGFAGLLLGPQVLGLVNFDSEHLGTIIYHLMSVGFIALALKDRSNVKNKDIVNTGIIIVNGYVLQGIIGFGLSLLMVYMFLPKLFPVFGMLLPLGYGQGAGQAYSMGKQWESLGFINGGNIGLSMAAMGLLWACIGGIPLMNYLIRIKLIRPSHSINNNGSSIKGEIKKAQRSWRNVVATAARKGIPTPAFSTALNFYDSYRSERLPANLLQAQRDYFGAHTYERVDKPRGEFFHTNWTGHGGTTASGTYTV
jgi:sodium--glutamate symport carrier gltS